MSIWRISAPRPSKADIKNIKRTELVLYLHGHHKEFQTNKEKADESNVLTTM